jgi:hypothetical protein
MSVNSSVLSTFSNVSSLPDLNKDFSISSHHNDNKYKILSHHNDNDNDNESILSSRHNEDMSVSTYHTKDDSTASDKKSYDINSNCGDCNKTCSSESTSSLLHEYIINKPIPYKIYIDTAVICEEFNNIELKCDDHIINLDDIDVTMDMFQLMFYPYKENYGLNRDFFVNNQKFLPFISFFPEFRSVQGKKFYLLEQIISNIELDLNISRHCFTKDTLVELTNEITNIKTLLDIKCCSVLSSITWHNILDIIKNYSYIHKDIIPILIVNIVFKTPTKGVRDSIIRFHYRICNYDIK